PPAAPRHRALLEAGPGPRRAAVVQVRHAPRPLRAAPRRRALLRALRRDVAPLDPQPFGREELARLDEAGPCRADPVPDARAEAVTADDGSEGVPRGARARCEGEGDPFAAK